MVVSIDDLEKLAKMKKNGLLTDKEFEELKQTALNSSKNQKTSITIEKKKDSLGRKVVYTILAIFIGIPVLSGVITGFNETMEKNSKYNSTNISYNTPNSVKSVTRKPHTTLDVNLEKEVDSFASSLKEGCLKKDFKTQEDRERYDRAEFCSCLGELSEKYFKIKILNESDENKDVMSSVLALSQMCLMIQDGTYEQKQVLKEMDDKIKELKRK